MLAERVVDAKIAAGIESVSSREELVKEHCERKASSLADSLRDLAKMPVRSNASVSIPEITNEAEVNENDGNVISLDEETKPEEKVTTAEQIFVDAFMGRRKL